MKQETAQRIHDLLKKTTSVSKINRSGFFYKKDYKENSWPPAPHPEVYGEVQLFRRILDYALCDYLSNDEEVRTEVEEWLCLDDPDFEDVCEFAYIDPEIVFRIFIYFKENLSKKRKK